MRAPLLLGIAFLSSSASAFQALSSSSSRPRHDQLQPLSAANRKSSFVEEEAAMKEMEEKDAGVVGAAFFGGNKQKEELFDPVAEANAVLVAVEEDVTKYVKWDDVAAFPDATARAVAKSMQGQLNGLLYTDEKAPTSAEYSYSSALDWQSPFQQKDEKTPLDALRNCLEFYNRLDVAITAAKSISESNVQVRWEISVAWPNFWEGRVLVTGSSSLTIRGNEIVKQVDTADSGEDLNALIADQAKPRFWDSYHIGMTPSAELSPKFNAKSGGGPLSSYKVYDLPPRLAYTPSLYDTGNRQDAVAATVPNHAFCDFIKTMGPRRQRYIPASPLEVQIQRGKDNKESSRLKFSMPLSVELQTNPTLPLPGDDPETKDEAEASASYTWQDARKVACWPYAGNPQDPAVADLRKKLYEQVMKDGLYKPKVDDDGRPIFFFWFNNVKVCYTETGLGMSVYEYRPAWAKASEVGLELETRVTDLATK